MIIRLFLGILLCVLCIGANGVFTIAHALTESDYDLTPAVIDRKGKVRSIIKETIRITNTSERKLNLFPTVNDIDREEGKELFISAQDSLDREASLANWIELSRGEIEIAPGEEKEIPFVIRVNMNALPDTYHAVIMFSEGSNREEAEKRGSDAKVMVNLEIEADIKETMQLNAFTTDSVFISGDDIVFNYQIENIGNQELVPKGEIRIYDRKGQEVAAIPVNEDGKRFNPDEAVQLASAWNAAGGFGKYKAFLNIEYGNERTASVYDTIYFWIFPWQQLLGIFIASFLVIIGFAFYFHRWLENRHMARLALMGAHGGVIQTPTIPSFGMATSTKVPEVVSPEVEEVVPPVEEPKRFSLKVLKWKMILSSLFRGKRNLKKSQSESLSSSQIQENTSQELRPRLLKDTLQTANMVRNRSLTQAINLKHHAKEKKDPVAPHQVVNLKK